jgi:hypothetical protein
MRLGNVIFFVLLLTLIVTLYDRYEPFHGVRFERSSLRPVQVQRLAGDYKR